jgi:molybdate transport system substrate-binding protein
VKPFARSSIHALLAGAVTCLLATGCREKRASADATGAAPAELTIAAAADLKFALDTLASEFQSKHPRIRPAITYGSSGNFHAQILNGAPFDLYLSADAEYPRNLAGDGLALEDETFVYAIGRIVVWVPETSPVDVETLGIESLFAPSVRKIAIANPQHAPYGKAAVAALRTLGVYERAAPNLVLGENIAQTAQFVQSGAADTGVIALSLALAPEMKTHGRYWEIPFDAYPKMEQGGMILKRSAKAREARVFRDFLVSDHGRAVLKQYGFFLPGN